MILHLAARAGRLVIVLFLVTGATFLLLNILPGDVAVTILGENASPEALAQLRAELGLDRPLLERWWSRLTHALMLDLGRSTVSGIRVSEAILLATPVSFQLMAMAQAIALALALPTGILAGYRPGGVLDRAMTTLAMIVLAAPIFLKAIVLVFLFSIALSVLPAAGFTPITEDLVGNLRSMVLPALAIGISEWPVLMRVLRSDMISTLQEDYITLARAKGLGPASVLLRHALKPSSFTLMTIVGLQVAALIGGALVTETIFALPGVGRLLVNAIYERDVMMVQGVVAFIACAYVLVNFTIDVLYTVLDPRVGR